VVHPAAPTLHALRRARWFWTALASTLLTVGALAQTAPTKKPAAPSRTPSRYHLTVNVRETRLRLYDGETLEQTYSVATGMPGVESPVGEGRILAVIFKPDWHPMPATRKLYKQKKNIDLPETVHYGDPLHMMGSFKMVLSHPCTTYNIVGVYAIHGTPNEACMGKRVSGGCVRMKKDEGEALAHKLDAEMKAGHDVAVTITL
jgi:lipoprotein-anchoring transpeptidase ErfK/SrfK